MQKTANSYADLFNKQKENQFNVANAGYRERIQKLNALKNALDRYKDKIRNALHTDLRKPVSETDLWDIYPVLGEIKLAKKHLRSWMGKQRVATPMALLGSTSWIRYEPKGVCLLISPWNFPINLTFGPLVSAIAAGNTVIIKPSEMTPRTAAVMAEMIGELFPENEVALFEGGIEESRELLKLPFNHIFFTGSSVVGKIVMKAAAEHLSSVTLELGGKSPTIVDNSANVKTAARLIVWGKFGNNGQTCIAPDYLLVEEGIKESLLTEIKKNLISFYSIEASQSPSYGRIVNKHHFNRLQKSLDDVEKKGGKIEFGGKTIAKDLYMEPTVISQLPQNALLLQEEIFGPLLPVIAYNGIDEAIAYINSMEKPLALYIFSKNKKAIDKILGHTRAGSSCINTNVLQYANHHLPFGGTNHSGIGKSHGFYGFLEFSNQRSVLKQHTKSGIELLFPPYTKTRQQLISIVLKWL